jgi:uncharacterized membrane protein
MTVYLWLKWVHVLSATVLFGTGIGIAFFRWSTDRSGDIHAIRVVAERTVLADWLFTTPAGIIQFISGLALAHLVGYPLLSGWVLYALGLFILAGGCWLPVVWLQLKMRDMARDAERANTPLPARYWSYAKI